MQSATICVLLLFGLFFCVVGKRNCQKPCPRIFDPICASIKIKGKSVKCTFSNKCFLEVYMCENNLKKLEQKPGSCADKNPQCIGAAGSIVRHPLV
ncbi:hypothetical protein CVS40_9968 [Lucilia cuprina]|nr:hypothetical protein CVS40_9968 [Lucilia cuprina]